MNNINKKSIFVFLISLLLLSAILFYNENREVFALEKCVVDPVMEKRFTEHEIAKGKIPIGETVDETEEFAHRITIAMEGIKEDLENEIEAGEALVELTANTAGGCSVKNCASSCYCCYSGKECNKCGSCMCGPCAATSCDDCGYSYVCGSPEQNSPCYFSIALGGTACPCKAIKENVEVIIKRMDEESTTTPIFNGPGMTTAGEHILSVDLDPNCNLYSIQVSDHCTGEWLRFYKNASLYYEGRTLDFEIKERDSHWSGKSDPSSVLVEFPKFWQTKRKGYTISGVHFCGKKKWSLLMESPSFYLTFPEILGASSATLQIKFKTEFPWFNVEVKKICEGYTQPIEFPHQLITDLITVSNLLPDDPNRWKILNKLLNSRVKLEECITGYGFAIKESKVKMRVLSCEIALDKIYLGEFNILGYFEDKISPFPHCYPYNTASVKPICERNKDSLECREAIKNLMDNYFCCEGE